MIDYSIKNPLVVNLFLLLIVVIGIISWHSMPEETSVEKDAIKIIIIMMELHLKKLKNR